MIYAHEWKDLGKERIPRWPSKIGEKRGINVDIHSWVGISIGAKHVEVRVKEENNSWWCEDENDWMELSCDSQKRGYELDASVLSENEAVKVAKMFIKIIGGKDMKNHKIAIWNGPGKPRRI